MISRKTLVIWWGVIVITAASILLMKNNWSGNDISEEWLLQKYEDLLQKAKNQAAQECENANDFSQQTKEIESIFDRIRQQKHDQVAESQIEEYIPPIPGSEPLDFDMEEDTPKESEEYIPRPWELPLDLDGNAVPLEEKEYIPRPGEQVPDLGDPETDATESNEYIPPIPWSEALDFDMGEITTIQKINNIELEIKDLLDALQTKCEKEKPSNTCEKACNNYTNKCLSLVPNAGKGLFEQGFSSCVKECKKRDKKKIQCMENAKDCIAMTEVCWL